MQITNVLQKNDDNFNPFRHDFNHDLYDSSYSFGGNFRKFVIPKRLNYGTYKPSTYPTTSRCTCDNMPAPIVIYNEMQIVTDDYEWIDDDPDNPALGDASKNQFNNLKLKAELSVRITGYSIVLSLTCTSETDGQILCESKRNLGSRLPEVDRGPVFPGNGETKFCSGPRKVLY